MESSMGVIVCAMRHHSTEDNMRMIKTAREYLGSGVCAADLAGAEALYPMSEFMDIFTETKKMGMPFTLHAGECGNPQNVIDSDKRGSWKDRAWDRDAWQPGDPENGKKQVLVSRCVRSAIYRPNL